jgi:uncharacterized membrane protein YfcA
MTLQYWYMLPVSVLIATIAMASGVGGATFFSPLFILALLGTWAAGWVEPDILKVILGVVLFASAGHLVRFT